MKFIKKIIRRFGFYRLSFPPGHYASPIPDFDDILQRSNEIFNKDIDVLGIDLNEKKQIQLLENIIPFIKEFPYLPAKTDGYRYYYNNPMFKQMDGLILYSMLRYFKPNMVIEIGSGFSSAICLDVNNRYFNNNIKLTFIEPFPDRLYSLLNSSDSDSIEIIVNKVQNVSLEKYKSLQEGDIFFLDTSHILKTGSDISFWLFNILPRLKKGVIIHIHDIFYPFEYPQKWIEEQKCYNEIYFVRSFLMNNDEFEILLFNSWVSCKHHEWLKANAPFCLGSEGSSFWLRKIK